MSTRPYTRPLSRRITAGIDLFFKRCHNYRYFRALGKSRRVSWDKAGKTLNRR